MLLLVLVTGAAGPFVSLRLLAWASSNMPRASADGSRSTGGSGGSGGLKIATDYKIQSLNLGPDSIPSVVRVERLEPLSALPGLSGPAHPGHVRHGLGEGEDSDAADLGGGGRRDVCRNTVQGVALLADSEGRVCRRADLDRRRPGCCNARPLPSATGGGSLPHAVAEAISSTEGHVIQDTTSLGEDRWRNEAGGVEEVFTSRALASAAAGRQLASRQGGDGYGFPPEEALSTPFPCWSCDAGERGGMSSSCCASYEFCVSCCQDPRRKKEREAVRNAAVRSGHPAYGGLGYGGGGGGGGAVGGGKESASALRFERGEDRIDDEDSYQGAAFNYCAFRCRTYSGSVVHENSFRSPLKHCFGRFRPPAAPGVASNSDGGGGGSSVASQGGEPLPLQLDPLLVGFISE